MQIKTSGIKRKIRKAIRRVRPLRELEARLRAKKVAKIRARRTRITAEAIRLVESPQILQGYLKGNEYWKAARILELLNESGVDIGKYGQSLMNLRRAERGLHSGYPTHLNARALGQLGWFREHTIERERPVVEGATEAEKEALRKLIAGNADKLEKILNS